MTEIKVKKLSRKEIKNIVAIASEGFSGMRDLEKAKKWITGNFKNYPRMQYFVAKLQGEIVGYILWVEKGGFRKESVFELEQVTVKPEFRGRGIASQLILKSLDEIKTYLKKRRSSLKIIEATTGKDRSAENLYRKTLGAKTECSIKDLFRGDEVIMIARLKR